MDQNNHDSSKTEISNLINAFKNNFEIPKVDLPTLDTSFLSLKYPQIDVSEYLPDYEDTVPGKLDILKEATVNELSRINGSLTKQIEDTNAELEQAQMENKRIKRESRIWNAITTSIALISLLITLLK